MALLVSIGDALGIGSTYNRYQIRYQNKIISDSKDLQSDASIAEKLITTFKKGTGCTYSYVTNNRQKGLS